MEVASALVAPEVGDRVRLLPTAHVRAVHLTATRWPIRATAIRDQAFYNTGIENKRS